VIVARLPKAQQLIDEIMGLGETDLWKNWTIAKMKKYLTKFIF
jgi:hypothetical protein